MNSSVFNKFWYWGKVCFRQKKNCILRAEMEVQKKNKNPIFFPVDLRPTGYLVINPWRRKKKKKTGVQKKRLLPKRKGDFNEKRGWRLYFFFFCLSFGFFSKRGPPTFPHYFFFLTNKKTKGVNYWIFPLFHYSFLLNVFAFPPKKGWRWTLNLFAFLAGRGHCKKRQGRFVFTWVWATFFCRGRKKTFLLLKMGRKKGFFLNKHFFFFWERGFGGFFSIKPHFWGFAFQKKLFFFQNF